MKPTNPLSLVDVTVNRIVDLIISTDIAMLPPQDVLAKQLVVSRPVLREAVSKLEMLNIVSPKPKVGTKINPPSAWQVMNGNVIAWRVRAGEKKERVIAAAVDAARETAVC